MPLDPPVVILADGAFPTHHIPVDALHGAGTLICCDGAANRLVGQSPAPTVVVGDLDSLSAAAREGFGDRLVSLPSQQASDLEKALLWAAENGAEQATVLGATGRREDHSLGNLLMLMTDFGMQVNLLTDTGTFSAVRESRSFGSFPGQSVSLFPESAEVLITTSGLEYPLENRPLVPLHRGTSNRCAGDKFSVVTVGGAVLVYQGFAPEP